MEMVNYQFSQGKLLGNGNLNHLVIILTKSKRVSNYIKIKECCKERKKKTDLDSVASEHELAHNNTTNPASCSNNKHSSILSPRNSKLTHRTFSNEKGIKGIPVISSSCTWYLPQPWKLPPHLIKQLPWLPPQPHRVHIIQTYWNWRLLLLLLLLF